MPSAAGPLVLAVDQGTSATKAILLSVDGSVVHRASVPVGISHPRPGWVEQDADELLRSVHAVIRSCLDRAPGPVAAVGISSQRESALLWDRSTGAALGPVLGWQDRRTQAAAEAVATEHADLVRAVTGLPVDPMFSAVKLRWLLDQVDRSSPAAARDVAAGTVDSWLVHRLTGEHRVEAGNASRTQLLDVQTAQWDPRLLEIFGIPALVLPRVAGSAEPTAAIRGVPGLDGVRVTGVLADSHAALFAHGVRAPGQVKATYGTGASVMGLLGDGAGAGPGLVRTIAWQLDRPVPAFEGNVLAAGAAVVWLAGLLSTTPAEVFALAQAGRADHGLCLVPAFAGLGAPWWDTGAQGVLTGFRLDTTRADLARAAVEAVAWQVEDVLEAAQQASGRAIGTVLVDGGPTANAWLLQLQADTSRRRVVRSDLAELSATGAAHCALLGSGEATEADLAAVDRRRTVVDPSRPDPSLPQRAARWRQAVGLARAAGRRPPGIPPAVASTTTSTTTPRPPAT